jgi:hypothetical protein
VYFFNLQIKESQSNVEDHYSLIDVASLLFKYKLLKFDIVFSKIQNIIVMFNAFNNELIETKFGHSIESIKCICK